MKYFLTLLFFISINPFLKSQHIYTGYNINSAKVNTEWFLNGKLKTHTTHLTDKKKIVKYFSSNGLIIEELVITGDSIAAGVEYFTNDVFPFLPSPRSFQMAHIDNKTPVRLYKHKKQFYYVSDNNGQQKILFK